MKKKFFIFLSFLTAVSITSCTFGQHKNTVSQDEDMIISSDTSEIDEKDYDIALITDSKGIEDETNLALWKSVIAYGDSNAKTYKYYSESADTNAEALIAEAVERNAKIVVLPNSGYKDMILNIQETYPNVSFLLVNTLPDQSFSENVHCVSFKEEQTGYLAGYLLVMEGYKSIGFIGNENNDQNMRYIYGMVQGADDAIQELRLHDVELKYGFVDAKEDKSKQFSKKMYSDGIEVVFVCNKAIAKGVEQSAKESKKKLLCGVGAYSTDEEICLGSIEYDEIKSVDYAIKSGFDENLEWLVGKENRDLNLGFESGCIEVPTDDSNFRFKNLNGAFCEKIIEKLANGEISVSDKTDSKPPIAALVYSEYK